MLIKPPPTHLFLSLWLHPMSRVLQHEFNIARLPSWKLPWQTLKSQWEILSIENVNFLCQLRLSAARFVHIPTKMGIWCINWTLCLQDMNRSHAASFSQEEQLFMKNIKYIYIMAKSNTTAATNARERSQLKVADRVNKCRLHLCLSFNF